MNMQERELREKRARQFAKMSNLNEKMIDGNTLTINERAKFAKLSKEMHKLDRQIDVAKRSGNAADMGTTVMTADAVQRAHRAPIAHDTSDLPSPDKPIEARHDLKAWYERKYSEVL